ncbi:MAG: ABC transporter substrate-binding protein [Firmicutes bacterium]|nr:ABC transporter substrate-binding protein [Bacillota bacterium]
MNISRLSRSKSLVLILSLLLMLVFMTVCGTAEAEEIQIVVVGPMTGGSAEWGESMREGTQMAVDEINNAGGVLGRRLVFKVEDDQGNPNQAVSLANKIITEPNVTAIIGHFFTSCTMAAGPIYQREGIPIIAIASTHPDVPKIGDFIFRVNPTNTHQGSGVINFAVERLGFKRLAILYVEDDYGRGIFEVAQKTANDLGIDVVYSASHPASGEVDFTALLTRAKAGNPDALMLFNYYTQAAQIVRQMDLVGFEVPVLGSDGLLQPGFLKIGGQYAEGTYIATWFHPESDFPETVQYVKAYEARFNKASDTWSPFAYDAVMVLAEAIERASTTDHNAVRDEMARTDGYVGPTGVITFDEDGAPDVTFKKLLFVQVKDGKFELIKN